MRKIFSLAAKFGGLGSKMFEKILLTDGRLSHRRGDYTVGIVSLMVRFLHYTFISALFADGSPFSWTKEDVNHLYSANILMSSDGTLLHIFEY